MSPRARRLLAASFLLLSTGGCWLHGVQGLPQPVLTAAADGQAAVTAGERAAVAAAAAADAAPPSAAAGAAAGSAAAAGSPAAAADSRQGRKLAPAVASGSSLFFAEEFEHPLSQPQREQARAVALQAHTSMQRWLDAFFKTPASRLTSFRLERQRQAAAAAAAAQAEAEAAAKAAATAAAAASGVPQPGSASGETGEQAEQKAEETDGRASLPGSGGFVDVPAGADAGAAAPGCSGAACSRAAAEQLLVRHERLGGNLLRLRWQPFEEDARRWAALPGGTNGSSACLPAQPGEAVRRDFLVVVPVGNDISNVLKWMDQPASAIFDLVLLYYGSAPEPPPCPHCAAVLSMAGPKWHLLWQATQLPAWGQLVAGKRAIMAADDDLVMDTCTLNRAFEVFAAYGLLLGQPSLCPTRHRPSWYLHLLRDEAAILRFVTMVEIMAPIFEAGFFQDFVRHSLHDAYTGWGLDFVWPFLLQYPRDRVAVIDDACMTHPHSSESKKGEGSVYAALARMVPYDSREEEARRDAQYTYYPSEIRALGFPYRPIEVVGLVPRPPPPPPPPEPQRTPGIQEEGAGEGGLLPAQPGGEEVVQLLVGEGEDERLAPQQLEGQQLEGQQTKEQQSQKQQPKGQQLEESPDGREEQPAAQQAGGQDAGAQQQVDPEQLEGEQAEVQQPVASQQRLEAQAEAQFAAAQQALQAAQANVQQAQEAQQAVGLKAAPLPPRPQHPAAALQQAALAGEGVPLVAHGGATAGQPGAGAGVARAPQHQLAAAAAAAGGNTHVPTDPVASAAARREVQGGSSQMLSFRGEAAGMGAALTWSMQHWLLFAQLSILLGASAALLVFSKQRRPGSPRPLPLFNPPSPLA